MIWQNWTFGITAKDIVLILLGILLSALFKIAYGRIPKMPTESFRRLTTNILKDIWYITWGIFVQIIPIAIGNAILLMCVYLFGDQFNIYIDFDGLINWTQFMSLVLLIAVALLIIIYIIGLFCIWIWEKTKTKLSEWLGERNEN